MISWLFFGFRDTHVRKIIDFLSHTLDIKHGQVHGKGALVY